MLSTFFKYLKKGLFGVLLLALGLITLLWEGGLGGELKCRGKLVHLVHQVPTFCEVV